MFRDVRTQVLIVPSGIETMFINGKGDWGIYVLIVPSGIETGLRVETTTAVKVLIVPSGIETCYSIECCDLLQSINCT